MRCITLINLEKEIREQPGVLCKVIQQNAKTYDALIARIREKDPRHVYFAARGTSDHASIYAQYLFAEYLGIPCGLSTPSAVTHYGAKMQYERSVVIGVSQSGAAEDVNEVLKQAKESGAITVAVTNTPGSLLSKTADFHLCCFAGPEVSIAATKTFTAQMYLLAWLVAYWSGNDELKRSLSEVPLKMDEAMEGIPAQLDALIPRFTQMTEAVVLGRGYEYPIALEGALKVLETNRVRMKGYSIADFYHGPLAQIYENEPVFLFAVKGPAYADALAMIERLDGIGAEVITVTDDDDLAKRPLSVKIPAILRDTEAPYLTALVMQLFACKLTEARGIDPDAVKVLKKVTVTK